MERQEQLKITSRFSKKILIKSKLLMRMWFFNYSYTHWEKWSLIGMSIYHQDALETRTLSKNYSCPTTNNFHQSNCYTSSIHINQRGRSQNGFILQSSLSYGITQARNSIHYNGQSYDLDLSKFHGPSYDYFPKKTSYYKYQHIGQSLLESNYFHETSQS